MGDFPRDEIQLVYHVGSILQIRNYNRHFLLEESQEPELNPAEYVFLTVFEFWTQVHINGFEGFLANTDGEYLNFLPIALAAVGAMRSSDIVRRARDPEVKTWPKEGQFDEDYGALLLAYARAHRDELPDPEEVNSDRIRAWKDQRMQWWEQRRKKEAEERRKVSSDEELFLSRVRWGNLPGVQALHDKDPSLIWAKKPHTEETALHLAARHGHADVVRLLIERRADVNAQAIECYSPLTAALWAVGNPHRGTTDERQLRIAEMIRKAGGR